MARTDRHCCRLRLTRGTIYANYKEVKTSRIRKPPEEEVEKMVQGSGQEWIILLKRADLAKTAEEKKHWRRQAMRAFYGDNRGDEYA